jgi:hypothetical protein
MAIDTIPFDLTPKKSPITFDLHALQYPLYFGLASSRDLLKLSATKYIVLKTKKNFCIYVLLKYTKKILKTH